MNGKEYERGYQAARDGIAALRKTMTDEEIRNFVKTMKYRDDMSDYDQGAWQAWIDFAKRRGPSRAWFGERA